jgi:CheY-like chemotaxis protein
MKNILVIDDSTTNIVLLQAVLFNKGYNVISALSVKEAFNIIINKKIDLILCDLLMPRINGFEFIINIKDDKNFNNIPIVVVSALTDSETIKKVIQLGATNFIKKPVDIQSLIECVNTILGKEGNEIYLLDELNLIRNDYRLFSNDINKVLSIIYRIKKLKTIIYILKKDVKLPFQLDFIETIYVELLEFETKFDNSFFKDDSNKNIDRNMLIEISNDEKVDDWIKDIIKTKF